MESISFLRRAASILGLVLLFAAVPGLASAQGTVDLAVQYAVGTPKTDQVGYDVKVYISVLDSANNPVKDLTAENFTVAEDSQKVKIDSVGPVTGKPINVVLLIDTSGSMGGKGIESARAAASKFVQGMGASDEVAVLTFDNAVKNIIDFTKDHKAIQDQIALINAVANADTCLYDAAYQAAQMTATVPDGRRAVVLLTDGRDERLKGGVCSAHSADDLIDLATTGNTRVPIYTLGLGGRVDEAGLNRLAADTGGRYLPAKDSTQLDALFQRLADQLRSQYLIQYTSTAGPGAHGLAVTVNYREARDTDTRTFLLPGMPVQISFVSPAAGQSVSGKGQLAVVLSGQSEPVANVTFLINGETVRSVSTLPYQVDVDFSNYQGDLTVQAVVYGAGNKQLAAKSIDVKVAAAAGPADVTPVATPTPIPGSALALGGSVLLLVLIGAGVFAYLTLKRRREEKQRDDEWIKSQTGEVGGFTPTEDRTMDAWEPNPDALGTLVVEASDDPSMIGKRFDITGSLTRLGRSADNDVPFPKDSPVSRHHAEISERNGGLFFSEVMGVDSSGNSKSPVYGTCINDRPVGSEPTMLQTGDVIQLGKRVLLRFQAGKARGGSDETYDGLMPDDPEKTREE